MSKDCDSCGHSFDAHRMLTENPMQGGIMVCPFDDDCTCFLTWSPKGVPVPAIDVQHRLYEEHCRTRASSEH